MKKIDKITSENFLEMYNLKNIIEGSVFYPASGIDGTAIECLSRNFNSFVQVDFSTNRNSVKKALENDFFNVGYELIGVKSIEESEINPNGFSHVDFQLNEHERQRLKSEIINEKFQNRFIKPFAFWAIFELNSKRIQRSKGKIKRFSLLHVCGEACANFETLYLDNKINPDAVVIINPSEGYGDNWTIFRDNRFRFYQNIKKNHIINGVNMPKTLLTNMTSSDNEQCFWPRYRFKERRFCNGLLRIYNYLN